MKVWLVLSLALAGVQFSEVRQPTSASPRYAVRLVLRGGEDSGDSVLPRRNRDKVLGRRSQKSLPHADNVGSEEPSRKRKTAYAVPQDLKPFQLLLELQRPGVEIPEALLKRNMTEDETADILKVLNLVPLEDGSIDPDELQHQLPARSRLLVEYYRQRMVENADGSLVRMDALWPDVFHTLDFMHNLQDGYFTAHRLRRQNASSDAMQVERVLIPINKSPMAHTREVDRSLWTAAAMGDAEAVVAALARGADASAIDWRFGRWSVLHHAAGGGSGRAILKLAEHGANVSAATDDGLTPLHTAAAEGKVDAVEQLVQLGADIDARTEEEETPLHRAAANGQADAAEKLVELGADMLARNVHLKTPSSLAAAHATRPPDGADKKARREKLLGLAQLLAPGGVADEDGHAGDPFFEANPERIVFLANIAHTAQQSEVESRLVEAVGKGGVEQVLLAPARPEVDVGADGKRLLHRGYGWAKLRSEGAVRRSLKLHRKDLRGRPLAVKRHAAKQAQADRDKSSTGSPTQSPPASTGTGKTVTANLKAQAAAP